MKDNIKRNIYAMRAAYLIFCAVDEELKDDAAPFTDKCIGYDDAAYLILDVFESLGFKERYMIASRLGFDVDNYNPKMRKKYDEISWDLGYSSPQTSSRVIKQALSKIGLTIIFGVPQD